MGYRAGSAALYRALLAWAADRAEQADPLLALAKWHILESSPASQTTWRTAAHGSAFRRLVAWRCCGTYRRSAGTPSASLPALARYATDRLSRGSDQHYDAMQLGSSSAATMPPVGVPLPRKQPPVAQLFSASNSLL